MGDNTTVTVLGTGIMGSAITRRLLSAGMSVTTWNRTREKAEELVEHGATVADSPFQAATESEIVLTTLSDGQAVEDVMTGQEGAISGMEGRGCLWIQCSTVGLTWTDHLMELAADNQVPFVDAPVLGTREPAERGELVVMASGPDHLRSLCWPVFDAIARKTLWLGQVGLGTRLKLVANDWLVGLVSALAESVALAETLGVDPLKFLETIEGGPVGSPYALAKGRAMATGGFSTSFRLKHARKDAALVLEAASLYDLQLPLTSAAFGLMDLAEELGHGEEDLATVFYAIQEGAS